MDDVATRERLIDLEVRQTLLGEALEELAPILAGLNGELIRAGVVSQTDGLRNQDVIALVARLAEDARRQAKPSRTRAAAAENGALVA